MSEAEFDDIVTADTITIDILPDGEIESDTARPRNGPRTKGDLTRGPILKTLISFAIPMLIGNVVQTLNGSINAIWVGRLLGESALAATTNANGVMFLLFALVFGFGSSTTVRVGHCFGAGDIAGARRTFGSGLGFGVIMAAGVSLAGWFCAPWLLRRLGTPAGSFAYAIAYLRVIFISMPFGAANMIAGMGLRGVGDSRAPMFSMLLTVSVDIVLNPLLIRGAGPVPGLGIAGSALASAIAGFAGFTFLVINHYRHSGALRMRGAELADLLPRSAELVYILSKGMPMGAQMLIVSSAQVVIIGLVNREGVDTTAAYGASMQLWNYLQMPAFAIGMAVSAMVAQNIGASNHSRVSEVTRVGMAANVVMTGVLAGLIVLCARPLLALFLGGASPALPIAVHIQHIVTWSWIVMGASMVVGGTMRAYGVVVWPLVIQCIALYPVRLGFYVWQHPRLGADALWWAFPLASSVSILLVWLLYARGDWRSRRHLAFQDRAISPDRASAE